MNKIFIIDFILIPLFLLSAYSGIELHIAGHGDNHGIWHNWAVFHVIVSTLFLVFGTLHVKTHWNWYKSLIKKGIGKKSKLTLAVSVTFVLATVTGIVLLGIDGANSGIGMWHYKIGLLTGLLALMHIIKRSAVLYKVLKK